MAASSGHNFWSRVERNLPKDGTRRRWQRALRLPTHPIYRSVLEFQSVWLIRTLQARHQCCATLQSTGVRARLPQTCGKQAQTSTALQSCPSWTAIILPHIPVSVQCSPIARHDTNRNYDIRKRRWRRRRTFSKEEKSKEERGKQKKIIKKKTKEEKKGRPSLQIVGLRHVFRQECGKRRHLFCVEETVLYQGIDHHRWLMHVRQGERLLFRQAQNFQDFKHLGGVVLTFEIVLRLRLRLIKTDEEAKKQNKNQNRNKTEQRM